MANMVMNKYLEAKFRKLGVNPALAAVALAHDQKSAHPRMVVEGERIVPRALFNAENSVAHTIRRLGRNPLVSQHGLAEPARAAVLRAYPQLHEDQVRAVNLAGSAPVMVITGGPGTGKTMSTRAVLDFVAKAGRQLLLAAPTGKAASVLSEATGREATTIHRLLGRLRPNSEGVAGVEFTARTTLLLDEASMIGVELADELLGYSADGMQLIMVGDVDQLPSIDPGRLLFDVIQSGAVPAVRLTKIFRQAEDSAIPYVARDINQGRIPSITSGAGYSFVSVNDPFEEVDPTEGHPVLGLAVRAVMHDLPTKYGYKHEDIVVLAPMRKGGCGVNELNRALQSRINPRLSQELDVPVRCGQVARLADRVQNKVNNYDKGVMNGEVGKVVACNPRGFAAGEARQAAEEFLKQAGVIVDSLTPLPATGSDDSKEKNVLMVAFPGDVSAFRFVMYNTDDALDMIDLAYACTIHGFQGSASKAVIFVCTRSHAFMLTRSLGYTALTRAREYCAFVGQPEALAGMVRNTRGSDRRTRLQDQLKKSA